MVFVLNLRINVRKIAIRNRIYLIMVLRFQMNIDALEARSGGTHFSHRVLVGVGIKNRWIM